MKKLDLWICALLLVAAMAYSYLPAGRVFLFDDMLILPERLWFRDRSAWDWFVHLLSFNQRRLLFPGDTLLFRPGLFFFSWIFYGPFLQFPGLATIWATATGVGAALLLVTLLRRNTNIALALLVCLLWCVPYADQHMIFNWPHINPYLYAVVFFCLGGVCLQKKNYWGAGAFWFLSVWFQEFTLIALAIMLLIGLFREPKSFGGKTTLLVAAAALPYFAMYAWTLWLTQGMRAEVGHAVPGAGATLAERGVAIIRFLSNCLEVNFGLYRGEASAFKHFGKRYWALTLGLLALLGWMWRRDRVSQGAGARSIFLIESQAAAAGFLAIVMGASSRMIERGGVGSYYYSMAGFFLIWFLGASGLLGWLTRHRAVAWVSLLVLVPVSSEHIRKAYGLNISELKFHAPIAEAIHLGRPLFANKSRCFAGATHLTELEQRVLALAFVDEFCRVGSRLDAGQVWDGSKQGWTQRDAIDGPIRDLKKTSVNRDRFRQVCWASRVPWLEVGASHYMGAGKRLISQLPLCYSRASYPVSGAVGAGFEFKSNEAEGKSRFWNVGVRIGDLQVSVMDSTLQANLGDRMVYFVSGSVDPTGRLEVLWSGDRCEFIWNGNRVGSMTDCGRPDLSEISVAVLDNTTPPEELISVWVLGQGK